MTRKEFVYFLIVLALITVIIVSIFLLIPSNQIINEPTVILSAGELQNVDGDLKDLPVNITCLNASITLVSVSSNACINLGVLNNESVDVIPLIISVNVTTTIYLRCSFQNNLIYLIEFHFQLQNYEFTENLKFEG